MGSLNVASQISQATGLSASQISNIARSAGYTASDLAGLYNSAKSSGLSDRSIAETVSGVLSGNSGGNGSRNVDLQTLSGLGSDFNSLIDQISGMVSANSARNSAEAASQRLWSEQQQQAQMAFNAQEAAKNRDWQQYMSDTAHQREVADLRAAGLNPVLSAMNGNGANVSSGATASASLPSGASATADTSGSGAIVSLLGHWINSLTQLQTADVSAKTNLAVADKYNAMSQLVAELNAQVSREGIAAGLTNTAVSARATEAASAISAAAARYGYDISNIINQEKLAQELYIREKYPDNQWRVLNDILQELISDRKTGSSGFSSAAEYFKKASQSGMDEISKIDAWISDVFSGKDERRDRNARTQNSRKF